MPKHLTCKHNYTNTNTRRKMNVEIMKKILSEKKTTLPFSQELRQDKCQVGNRKNKQRINKYSNEQHHGIKRSNLCWSEISLWEN